MIFDRIGILELMSTDPAELIENTDTNKSMHKFYRLCHDCRISAKSSYQTRVANIYIVNVALKGLRDGVGNGIWPKDIRCDILGSITDRAVDKYYWTIVFEKARLVALARKEIKMVVRLIETNVSKYWRILPNVGDIYTLDRICADIDINIVYIRRIIIKIPSIVKITINGCAILKKARQKALERIISNKEFKRIYIYIYI